MSDRDRLRAILVEYIPYSCTNPFLVGNIVDAIIKEGFGDVAARDKRIVELEKDLLAKEGY